MKDSGTGLGVSCALVKMLVFVVLAKPVLSRPSAMPVEVDRLYHAARTGLPRGSSAMPTQAPPPGLLLSPLSGVGTIKP